ncbi:hypothetical protein L211DRAFT_524765 [Terfezia boudieri ATCC MYA-4762]|uniref:BZIP domain-containing protein n=1 Tax=Terfezia boudieri ATCC MYA-4762 TaxID=1051890 RepID=A0A3N4LG04_9PEZI|nr:hypothetical protein L211DRAFT_524765 [Terfezia boudieri ATCC MYA-4762]
MGKVNAKDMFSDFELFPENVVPQSYHNHQSFHTSRGVSTATSTPARTSHHITGSLISPTLSSVGDNDFPSISSISYSTSTSKSTPTSRKRPTPTLPIEDSFTTPPLSSKIRKITSSTSTPSMKNLDESPRARSHRSQSPSQILASAVAEDTVAIKRARNTLAARRYRQKRVEKLEELEGFKREVRGREMESREGMGLRFGCFMFVLVLQMIE